jgi:tRNA 5-methylaminomethyl-2-thiouridine biosynthesis bifunctional protein
VHFDDLYATRAGGLAESRQVFLEASDLPDRWMDRGRFCIVETGFGTGLNFLATCQLWHGSRAPGALLHYIAVERQPLSATELRRALAGYPELQPWLGRLLEVYPPRVPGSHDLRPAPKVRLVLLFEEVEPALDSLCARVDAWFLDGFAPSRNPAMWTGSLFEAMARLSAPGASFATYTAAGAVRRGLQGAGFRVLRLPGFGGKRERLAGAVEALPSTLPDTHLPPWFRWPRRPVGREAVVVGAGIAGCATAWSLARRGWSVRLLDGQQEAAAAASGNPAGVIMPWLSARRSAGQRWHLQAFLLALRCIAELAGADIWIRRGVLALAWNQRERRRQESLLRQGAVPRELLSPLSADAASRLSGTRVRHPALYLPTAGAISPGKLCRALLQGAGPGLNPVFGVSVAGLRRDSRGWVALDADGGELARGQVLVLATGAAGGALLPDCHLPVQPVRGQLSRPEGAAPGALPSLVLCGSGYLVPAADALWVGATFQPGDSDPRPRAADDLANLALLGQLAPDLATGFRPGAARVGFRACTGDRLPLVGPVAGSGDLRDCYGDIRHGRAPASYPAAPCLPGVYANLGHGSRGLVSALLGAELLAARLSAEPCAVPLDLQAAVHPCRFLIRELRRGG